MVAEGLLIDRSALCTFSIFRTVGRRTIPFMTCCLLGFAALAARLVFGTCGSRTIPVMPCRLLHQRATG